MAIWLDLRLQLLLGFDLPNYASWHAAVSQYGLGFHHFVVADSRQRARSRCLGCPADIHLFRNGCLGRGMRLRLGRFAGVEWCRLRARWDLARGALVHRFA